MKLRRLLASVLAAALVAAVLPVQALAALTPPNTSPINPASFVSDGGTGAARLSGTGSQSGNTGAGYFWMHKGKAYFAVWTQKSHNLQAITIDGRLYDGTGDSAFTALGLGAALEVDGASYPAPDQNHKWTVAEIERPAFRASFSLELAVNGGGNNVSGVTSIGGDNQTVLLVFDEWGGSRHLRASYVKKDIAVSPLNLEGYVFDSVQLNGEGNDATGGEVSLFLREPGTQELVYFYREANAQKAHIDYYLNAGTTPAYTREVEPGSVASIALKADQALVTALEEELGAHTHAGFAGGAVVFQDVERAFETEKDGALTLAEPITVRAGDRIHVTCVSQHAVEAVDYTGTVEGDAEGKRRPVITPEIVGWNGSATVTVSLKEGYAVQAADVNGRATDAAQTTGGKWVLSLAGIQDNQTVSIELMETAGSARMIYHANNGTDAAKTVPVQAGACQVAAYAEAAFPGFAAPGYHFAHWSTSPLPNQENNTCDLAGGRLEVQPDETVHLYAHWTTPVTVKYYKDSIGAAGNRIGVLEPVPDGKNKLPEGTQRIDDGGLQAISIPLEIGLRYKYRADEPGRQTADELIGYWGAKSLGALPEFYGVATNQTYLQRTAQPYEEFAAAASTQGGRSPYLLETVDQKKSNKYVAPGDVVHIEYGPLSGAFRTYQVSAQDGKLQAFGSSKGIGHHVPLTTLDINGIVQGYQLPEGAETLTGVYLQRQTYNGETQKAEWDSNPYNRLDAVRAADGAFSFAEKDLREWTGHAYCEIRLVFAYSRQPEHRLAVSKTAEIRYGDQWVAAGDTPLRENQQVRFTTVIRNTGTTEMKDVSVYDAVTYAGGTQNVIGDGSYTVTAADGTGQEITQKQERLQAAIPTGGQLQITYLRTLTSADLAGDSLSNLTRAVLGEVEASAAAAVNLEAPQSARLAVFVEELTQGGMSTQYVPLKDRNGNPVWITVANRYDLTALTAEEIGAAIEAAQDRVDATAYAQTPRTYFTYEDGWVSTTVSPFETGYTFPAGANRRLGVGFALKRHTITYQAGGNGTLRLSGAAGEITGSGDAAYAIPHGATPNQWYANSSYIPLATGKDGYSFAAWTPASGSAAFDRLGDMPIEQDQAYTASWLADALPYTVYYHKTDDAGYSRVTQGAVTAADPTVRLDGAALGNVPQGYKFARFAFDGDSDAGAFTITREHAAIHVYFDPWDVTVWHRLYDGTPVFDAAQSIESLAAAAQGSIVADGGKVTASGSVRYHYTVYQTGSGAAQTRYDAAAVPVESLSPGTRLTFVYYLRSGGNNSSSGNNGGGTGGGNNGAGGDGLVEITDPEVPLAGLEDTDHFNYITGYPDGRIRPEANISREEVATIFYRLLSDISRGIYQADASGFSDLEAGRWSGQAIATLENASVLSGYPNGTFAPEGFITRAEFAAVVTNFDHLTYVGADQFHDIGGHWAAAAINSAAENGWISGYEDGSFRPDEYITRAEAIHMINRVLHRSINAEGLLAQARQWPDNAAGAWYYYDVLEATNYHDYGERADLAQAEAWTEIRPDRVWNGS